MQNKFLIGTRGSLLAVTQCTLIKNEIEATLSSLPNLARDDVPIGKNENSNKEIKKIGEIFKCFFF